MLERNAADARARPHLKPLSRRAGRGAFHFVGHRAYVSHSDAFEIDFQCKERAQPVLDADASRTTRHSLMRALARTPAAR
jgi:hypothetical protein